MTAIQSDPEPDQSAPPTAPARRSAVLHRLTYVFASLVLLASFGVWGYAYSGAARREPPDLLSNMSLAVDAEEICAEAVAEVEEMPGALEAVDGPGRRNQVLASTGRYEQMVDELDELVVGDERDVAILTGWLADWRVLLADRYRYAEAVAVDARTQFLLTDTGVNERLDRRISRLATTNSMPSCGTPQDVG